MYPFYTKNDIEDVSNILRSGKVNYWTGNICRKFEKEYAKYFNRKYAIAVSNGSVALEIALKSLNLKKTDEVIVTPRSFVISATCVLNVGCKPIFADVNDNGNLDIDSIKRVYTNKTKALIVVHLNGLPCDMDEIVKFCNDKKIYLIEDCAQSHGGKYKGKKLGSFGILSCWSFCQDKIITTGGEGGMITTNSKKLYDWCWSFKDHGKNYYLSNKKKNKIGFKWLITNYGSNYRMTEIQAVIGLNQLKTLDNQIVRRNFIASKYLNLLKKYEDKLIEKINFNCKSCPKKKNQCNLCTHAFYKLGFNLKKNIQKKVLELLLKEKVNCSIGWCKEIYREKIFKKINFSQNFLPQNAHKIGIKSIALPIYPNISKNKLHNNLSKIKKVFDQLI